MLDQESSQRLNLLRFPLIVGVVFIHAYPTYAGYANGVIGTRQNNFLIEFVRNLISQGFAMTAVPLFFLVSGYLFFVGFDFSKEEYLKKLRSRTKTLLIPFLFWNIATLLLIALAQAIPATKVFFSGEGAPIASYRIYDYLSAIFGIGRLPISFQFWFVRDLMLLVLLTPIINLANKYASLPFISSLLICWFLGVWPVYAPTAQATLFFSTGALLGASRKYLFTVDRYGVAVITAYLLIVVASTLFFQETFNPYLQKFGVVFGVVAGLFLTKLILASTYLKHALLSLGGASFFVFAAHEPLLTIARKVAFKITVPQSSTLVLALYFFIPTLVIVFLVGGHHVLSGIAPKILRVVTGRRN
jgi:surface polysaccharide O-acyltransferase-like enzyme